MATTRGHRSSACMSIRRKYLGALEIENAAGWLRALLSRISRAFGASRIFCYSSWIIIKPLIADPNLLQLERVSSEPDRITLIVKTKSKQALCPPHL
jgi:hypothetical protein